MGSGLILASGSTARARLLRDAGLDFEIEPADLDEGTIKRQHQAEGASAAECAAALAAAKARIVSWRHPSERVIGADQILDLDGEWFDKPATLDDARRQLVTLRERAHKLATAVCVCRDGIVAWRAISEPRLTMRAFSDEFLDRYLAAVGEAVLGSVGAYHLEGRGVQLFAAIEGDYFAIQGLPLVELLCYLRGEEAIVA